VVEDGKVKTVVDAFRKWWGDGMKVDGENHPVMSRICAVAIVKVLMPKVTPLVKASDFTTMKNCTKWLGELAGSTSWVDEMRATEDAMEVQEAETGVLPDA
jgi:hypothetical protein